MSKLTIPLCLIALVFLMGPTMFLICFVLYFFLVPIQVRYDEKREAKRYIGWSLERTAEELNKEMKLPKCMRKPAGYIERRVREQNGYQELPGYLDYLHDCRFLMKDGRKCLMNDHKSDKYIVIDEDDERCSFIRSSFR